MSVLITDLETYDIRFPTSAALDGSDAMNPDPDYSAAYVILRTNSNHIGHGLTFTIGRGNEICIAAIIALRHLIIGQDVAQIRTRMGEFWHYVTGDSQLRWIGPDKGALHLATGAVINAVWDLLGKVETKPVWRLVCDMTPQEIVNLVDFRYITDALTPQQALAVLERTTAQNKQQRIATLQAQGYPCYTTSAGWLGYSDDKLRRLCREARLAGFTHIKLKVGQNRADDQRRLRIAREEMGEQATLMVDANQVWDVNEAIDWMRDLAFAQPFFIEEPTSPDDIVGHRTIRQNIAPIKVATGEMCQNRIMFKQFITERAVDIVQIDACRLGGLNEVLAVQLMAAHYDIPIWPHAGGVGLCEYVQHLSMIDYVAVSGVKDDRRVEYVDHLHNHFVHPCVVKDGAYMPPTAPGFSIEMKADTLREFRFAH